MIFERMGASLIKIRFLDFYRNCASKINIWKFRGQWYLRSSQYSGKGSSEKSQGTSSEESMLFAHCVKKDKYCLLQTRHLPPDNQARKGHCTSPKHEGLWELLALPHPTHTSQSPGLYGSSIQWWECCWAECQGWGRTNVLNHWSFRSKKFSCSLRVERERENEEENGRTIWRWDDILHDEAREVWQSGARKLIWAMMGYGSWNFVLLCLLKKKQTDYVVQALGRSDIW